ncbi:hypothetical protein [Candidatus Methanoperedens nitratireducens]|uniref:Uncharacterized protein n=1 Tax=Candidatus Methanoperedens nitratireducens TaxID=1392998 RepID=A0A284VQ50_9EURY|nr:hypothetical protein [Candidatus Methanoperedens nitroreducens]SNQ61420.1 conserved hypothetical protein [Candidatus Methanoperedens nitroreducens]
MKNKMITGAIIATVLLSTAVLLWYFTPSDVSIVSLEAPKEIGIYDLSNLKINLQNNAPTDVNITINVKNAFVDEKGVSLKGFVILAYENSSYIPSNASNVTDASQIEVLLKPGSNSITVSLGYEVPGTQKVEVEIYQRGKLADSKTIEINVLPPKISVVLQTHNGVNGTNEIYTVYGILQLLVKSGSAGNVVVNISVINELTNTAVSTATRTIRTSSTSESIVVWSSRKSTYDPVTGMMTRVETETFAPVVVIELSKSEPSAEKYIMSPLVVKGKVGDRYRVIVTAMWRDQVVSSEVRIPSK